jgi:tRNA U54 and U55 pseudouridine synthase Pus10
VELNAVVELSGFTLFQNSKGWQLSTQLKSETGWSVRIVDETVAQAIFDEVLKHIEVYTAKVEISPPMKFEREPETTKKIEHVEAALTTPRFVRRSNPNPGRLF